MKILIVDDSARIRQLIMNLLKENGNQCFECEDGLDALTEYTKIKPDIVLMDIMMKKMNGLEASAQILNHFPEAKIIIITNFDDEWFRQKAKLFGIKRYILKDNLTRIGEIIKYMD